MKNVMSDWPEHSKTYRKYRRPTIPERTTWWKP
jgi:hypothetical protein